MFKSKIKIIGEQMKTQNGYSYTVIKDKDRNIIGILIRYEDNRAIVIPLIDVILEMEKII